MYKEYMLKCECWNPLDGIWEENIVHRMIVQLDWRNYNERKR